MDKIQKKDILTWLKYTEKTIEKKSLFGLKKKLITKIVNDLDEEVSFNFDTDWNDLMFLVKSIENRGYNITMSNEEIRFDRDYRINPYASPDIKLSVQLKKNDDKKSILFYLCAKFINKFNNNDFPNLV